jgi:hypothetical protein
MAPEKTKSRQNPPPLVNYPHRSCLREGARERWEKAPPPSMEKQQQQPRPPPQRTATAAHTRACERPQKAKEKVKTPQRTPPPSFSPPLDLDILGFFFCTWCSPRCASSNPIPRAAAAGKPKSTVAVNQKITTRAVLTLISRVPENVHPTSSTAFSRGSTHV